jgi:hypothetical protein
MSERGSFCTEYIYCDRCFAAVKAILLQKEKHLCSVVIPSWVSPGEGFPDEELPIIAGKIGGLYSREEVTTFMEEYGDNIERAICHPVRIAVIPDDEDYLGKIFELKPMKEKNS